MTVPPFLKSLSEDGVGERRRQLVRESVIRFTEEAIKEQEGLSPPKTDSEGVRLIMQSEYSIDEQSCPEHGEHCKVDHLFYRICVIMLAIGINFYSYRKMWMKIISGVMVTVIIITNFYHIVYLTYVIKTEPFNPDASVASLGLVTSTLQSTLSTIFLAYWQASSQFSGTLQQLYSAHKGIGIHANRDKLIRIVVFFYVVMICVVMFHGTLIFANIFEWDLYLSIAGMTNHTVVGNRSFFIIIQAAHMYTLICWAVALFIFVLLVQATRYEFDHFNAVVSSMGSQCTSDKELCASLIHLIKVHNRLTDCVKRLDGMFNKYTFVMIATIIPTSIFALFTAIRQADELVCFLFSVPILVFCVFSFMALTYAPSQLHKAIYNTKSSLCSNNLIWFPYRKKVYHSALAFMGHLDQMSLGISIWGFAVISKPLVLTTLSVMATCLALFLQVGQCTFGVGTGGHSHSHHH